MLRLLAPLDPFNKKPCCLETEQFTGLIDAREAFLRKIAVDSVVVSDIAKVLAMPEVRAKLANIGLEPVGTTPAEFAAIVRNDHAKWGEVIRNANIKLD